MLLNIDQYFSEILILDAPWPGPCPAHAADNMAGQGDEDLKVKPR